MICFQAALGPQNLCQECLRCLIKIDAEQVCPTCNRTSYDGAVCGYCLQHTWYFQRLYSAYHYGAMAKYLLHQLKFYQHLTVLPELAKLMHGALSPRLKAAPPEVLVPVPIHRWRMFQRGFNQAFVLAKYLGASEGIAVLPHIARKIKRTRAQAQLDFKNRQKNIRGSFQVQLKQPPPQSIWIIDDVFTTGATVNALAYEFIKAGVKQVQVATLFRAQ